MRNSPRKTHSCCFPRRGFLKALGAGAAALPLSALPAPSEDAPDGGAPGASAPRPKGVATIRGAFLYPPTQTLRDAGYWSWPGSSFDAEGHHKRYLDKIRAIEAGLGIKVAMEEKPVDGEESASRFIQEVKGTKPDGLLLIPFKKSHWSLVLRIVKETGVPSVVLATLGVLLVDHIQQLRRAPGAYLINAMDDLDAVEYGLRMIRTARWMRESRILNIAGSQVREALVPHLGTQVRSVPLSRFYEVFRTQEIDGDVKELARTYAKGAREVVEPTEADILEAARACFALRKILKQEGGDALMMDCLPGLARPHKHVPPCMGFMTLRDEGTAAGCQADLSATLTLMIVAQLFGKPGFQQNSSTETEENRYFGAHCTSPARMRGMGSPAEPYILRSHAEAGWGCVPQVLFSQGEPVTMAQYLPGEKPQLYLYSGKIAKCYPKAPGGCRTNIEVAFEGVLDACDIKGMHQIIFYGDHIEDLRRFCQLYGIGAVS